jgi:hypothetical protein
MNGFMEYVLKTKERIVAGSAARTRGLIPIGAAGEQEKLVTISLERKGVRTLFS